MTPELKYMCCPALVLLLVGCCLLVIAWAFRHVVALDRRIDGNKPTS